MNRPFINLSFLLMVASGLLSSCATSFRNFGDTPSAFDKQTNERMEIDYAPMPLNGQYAKRQQRSMCSLLYVKVTNHSHRPITLAKDVKVFGKDGRVIPIMDIADYYQATHQNPNRAWAFMALAPANFYSFREETHGGEVTDRKQTIIPIGLILGPALAFGNRAAAKGANRRYETALTKQNISNRAIAAGETVEGVIGLFAGNTDDLTFKLLASQ